jgi:hypothetical protein
MVRYILSFEGFSWIKIINLYWIMQAYLFFLQPVYEYIYK